MKKRFEKPYINITEFSCGEILTDSGVLEGSKVTGNVTVDGLQERGYSVYSSGYSVFEFKF